MDPAIIGGGSDRNEKKKGELKGACWGRNCQNYSQQKTKNKKKKTKTKNPSAILKQIREVKGERIALRSYSTALFASAKITPYNKKNRIAGSGKAR